MQQVDFLLTALNSAIIFCEIALSTKNQAIRERNIENALKAYRTALHFSQTPQHDLMDHPAVQKRLAKLKTSLHQLGHDV